MVIGDAKDLFLSVLGKKKVRRIREIFGGEGVPSTVMVRPKLIKVIYALESATKTKKRQADIWTIADVRNKTVVPIKNETPRQSNASSAEEAKGDSEAIVPSDPDQVKDQTADTLNARDDAPLPIGSARDQVFDYRTSRSIVKGLRDQARNTSDKVVATALRAYAREMTKETEEARKEYIALRGQLVGFSQNDPQWRNKACGGDR